MILEKTIKQASQLLKNKNIISHELDAQVILSDIMGVTRDFFITNSHIKVSKNTIKKFNYAIRRRIKREPVAYIIGKKEFWSQDFVVNQTTLVPRPETELLIYKVIDFFKNNRINILAIGTGSGCIALSMAMKFPHLEIVATDISKRALEVAKINTKAMKLEHRVKLIQADLFTNLSGCFDLIISNPPYVAQEIFENLPTEYSFEPQKALVAGENGLDFISRILQDAPPFLNDDGVLIIEAEVASTEVERVYNLPFTCISFEHGGEGVALIEAKHLE